MASLDIYEPLLEACIESGNIDYTQWPSLLPCLVERLSHIAHNSYEIPRPYPILYPVLPTQHPTNPLANREHFIENPPILLSNTPTTPRTLPPVPTFPNSSASRVPDSQADPPSDPQDAQETPSSTDQLPPEILQLLEQSLKTLQTTFAQKPPHTIQRLSELTLNPTKHYRTLPAWLRALDRVVSVSSGADIFPSLTSHPTSVCRTTRNGYDRDSLGSDESLGGALLTPIPWLKDGDLSSSAGSGSGGETASSRASSNSRVESWQDASESPEVDVDAEGEAEGEAEVDADAEMLPLVEEPQAQAQTNINMAETAAHAEAIAAVAQEHNDTLAPGRSDGAVTQGELIRMEQEAGVVPVGHEDVHRIGDEGIELDLEDEGDNVPHARGPDVVGTVDMGKVSGEERQVRISSPPEESMNRVDANDAQEVLSGGTTASKADNSGGSSDEFVRVEKEEVDDSSKKSDDGDIVLVDADGATEDAFTEEKADESGINVGADATDTTAQ
ncbi:hypothetical protein PMZ80_002403 [Knufia obscura]|uniref:Uncharacterized protein n=1 Tax=Knufia obscura TaxID=1635080 RepID=A0ABR0RY58_9EURO|nr:hypothetical protein PMZ80_002403 [Knufia obscura]